MKYGVRCTKFIRKHYYKDFRTAYTVLRTQA